MGCSEQVSNREGAPPSLLLDEIGLQSVAASLAGDVLSLLARLVFPQWSVGGRLDSYHAFVSH